jgi:hypothetical protein
MLGREVLPDLNRLDTVTIRGFEQWQWSIEKGDPQAERTPWIASII